MANNIGKKQIATYKNKVVEIVPEYNQYGAPKETITITKTSVIQGTYAPYSNNEQTEGMYILAHTINDSNYRTGDWSEYELHQLVAQDDLNYRFLLPTGEKDPTSPTYNPLLDVNIGCVKSSSTNRTISRDNGHNTYRTTLTPRDGYSKVPAGRIEKQIGENEWTSLQTWNKAESVEIEVANVDGNLRVIFDSKCIYDLTVYTTIDGVPQPNPLVIEGICETPINVDDYAQSIPGKTFVNITKDGTPISGEQDFCENISIYVNYTTNEYTVTNNIDPNCATVEISNPTPEYGDTVIIRITKTSDKANIGAGSISMVGADNPIYSWNKIVGPIEYTIDSVIGSITIDAECGDPAIRKVTIKWINEQGTQMHEEVKDIETGSTILPEDYISEWTLPEGYYISSMNPTEGTSIIVDSDKTIIYTCKLYLYTVEFVAGDGITITGPSSATVTYNEGTNSTYTISSEYRNAIETHTGTANVSLNNGSVVVSNVKSNVTVTISASQIPTYSVSFAFDDPNAGTLTSSTVQVIEGECAEVEYTLNQGYTIDTIDTEGPGTETHTSNTISVCDVTGDVNVTINTILKHTVTYRLTGEGVDLVRGGQIVPDQLATEIVEDGENSSIGFRLKGYYDTVIANCADPEVNPIVNYDNNTISVNNVTKDITILVSALKSPHTVNFEVYKDGTIDTSAGWSRQYSNGDTFNDVTFTYDDSSFEVNEVTSQELTVNYNYGDSGEIIISTETPITEDATVKIYLDSVLQRAITAIVASGMDAMGGVIFQAQFDDGTYDSNQNNFSVSYTDNNGNTSASKDVVDVFDYSLDKGSLDAEEGKEYVSGRKGIYQKSKLDLDYPSGSKSRTKQVTVTYQDYSDTLSISQRPEVYGYYTNGNDVFDASSSSEDLTSAIWNSSGLVDYGDSSNMYGGSDLDSSLKGFDGYNKDITPYYITGTYIGENPLDHLTDNEGGTITGDNKPSTGLSTYNGNKNTQYNEHYHITWNESNWNKAFRKGYIFSYDGLEANAGFCGGLPGDYIEGECVGTGLPNTTHTLEAISKESDHKVTADSTWTYKAYYHVPSHNYGKDAISYYHIDNSEYRWNINSENNPFKDVNENTLTFSYPLHISSKYELKRGVEIKEISDISSWGSGPTSYALSTVRLRIHGSESAITPIPEYAGYTLYEQSIHPAYYDYNNKLYLDHNTGTVIFAPYNNTWYEEDSEASRTQVQVGLTGQLQDMGRRVDIYYSLMSPETLIRPRTENGVTKFGVLSGVYNGTDYSQYEDKMYSVGVSDYISNVGLFGRTRYISQHSWNSSENESKEPTNDISIKNYPYTISGTNENYDRCYNSENDTYETLTTRPSEDTILEHRWYNLINHITFDQYYNMQNIKNNYFHTSSQAKYIDCSGSFDTGKYERYDINNGTKTWEEVVLEGVISIVKNPEESTTSRTVYTITTNEGVYPDCVKSAWYDQGEYYHRDTENVGTYYTNAEYIELSSSTSTGWLDCNNCGVGSITWTIKDDTGAVVHTDTLNDDSSTILSYQNPDGKPLTIEVEVSTNTKEYNKGDSDPYVEGEEENNVFTGGTLLGINATWDNGDKRHIDVGVQGSSKYGHDVGNPGESGSTILTWKNLNDYFVEGYNENAFTNSGNQLYHKVRPVDD